jgi:IS30 family transposase
MQQPHLTVEQRQLALRLKARGWTLREIGPQVDCAFATVGRIAGRGSRRPGRGDGWVPGAGRLTLADREEITVGLHAGESFTVIAARLGEAVPAVSREVAANGGRGGYRAWRAHRRARGQARRPKTPKLACQQLAAQVTGWLAGWWSPQQISRRLRIEFPGDPMMWVSHETRPSTRRCMCRAAASCAVSWPAACAPGGPSAGPAGGAVTPATSRTW